MIVNLPEQFVFGKPLYPTIFDKATILFVQLIKKHVFANANKRTAFFVLVKFLQLNGYRFSVTVEEAVEKEGFEVRSIEGKDGGKWILMDLNDVKDKILSGEDVIVRISGYCVNTKYLTPEQKAELTQRVFHEILSMDDALA